MVLRCTISPPTASAGPVLPLAPSKLTTWTSIRMVYGRRIRTTGTTDGASAAWRELVKYTSSATGVANGTDTGSGSAFNVGYQSNGWFKLSTTPLFFTRTGGLWDTDYFNTTTYASYWSATSYSGTHAYHLYAYSGGLYPANASSRGYGFVVRCLAR